MYLQSGILLVVLLAVMTALAAPVRRQSEVQDEMTVLTRLKEGLVASFQLAVSLALLE